MTGGTTPFIVTQPLSQGSVGGSAATFSVVANGTPTLTYQWRLNGTNISGATRTNLTISSPSAANIGDYNVRIANNYGSVISSNAVLAVVPLAIAAATEALKDAGIDPEKLSLEEKREIGVVMGSGGGAQDFSELQYLNVKQTAVSEEALKKLAAALPRCRIEWNGGVFEAR